MNDTENVVREFLLIMIRRKKRKNRLLVPQKPITVGTIVVTLSMHESKLGKCSHTVTR